LSSPQSSASSKSSVQLSDKNSSRQSSRIIFYYPIIFRSLVKFYFWLKFTLPWNVKREIEIVSTKWD
jgi:hypothetical protein